MDPITLSILFGAGALMGYAAQRNAQEQAYDRSIILRRVYETTDGWLCTELCNAQALNSVGQILNLNLLAWWPKVDSGCFKVIIITQPGAPLDRHIVVLLESAGAYGWYLNQAHRFGYRMVQQRIDYQRINSLIDQFNKDPAEEVAKTAAGILNAIERYKYLRYALTANPRLSALLSRSDDFLRITRNTVKEPSVRQLKAETQDRRRQALPTTSGTTRALPMYEEATIIERERVPVWSARR